MNEKTNLRILKISILSIPFFLMMTLVNADSTLSPQKQLKLGIDIEEIQCNETLLLLVKYDGSPACVTEKTHTQLIKRGWADPVSVIVFDESMENPYFTKYQMINVDANSKFSKQLICPSSYHLITGSIKPQDEVDIGYGMEKIRKYGQLGWQFNIENHENKIGIMKIQIDCTTDISQYEFPERADENQINLSA